MRYILASIIFFISSQITLAGELTIGFIPAIGSLGDTTYNNTAYRGIIDAKRALGAKLILGECKVPQDLSFEVAKIADKGASIIVISGYQYDEEITAIAKTYPNIKFILNEVRWSNTENAVSIFYDTYDTAFLIGALSSWVSERGDLAVIGGVKMAIIDEIVEAFREGALYANPSSQVKVVYLANDSSGFNMPERGYKVADQLYKEGTEVIMSLAALSGNGIIKAAVENDKFSIGIDADQDHMGKGHVLTSLMKHIDIVVKRKIIKAASGEFRSGVLYLGLKEGGVGLSPMSYTKDRIGEETIRKLNDLKNEFLTGNSSHFQEGER